MKLLYSGAAECDFETLKRLLIVSEEVAFMDSPATMFGEDGRHWGMVGRESQMRGLVGPMADEAVRLQVYKPPSGVGATPLFERYLGVDLEEGCFREVVLNGLQTDSNFTNRLVHPEARYGSYSGREIISSLINDPDLRHAPVRDSDMSMWFKVDDAEGRRATL